MPKDFSNPRTPVRQDKNSRGAAIAAFHFCLRMRFFSDGTTACGKNIQIIFQNFQLRAQMTDLGAALFDFGVHTIKKSSRFLSWSV